MENSKKVSLAAAVAAGYVIGRTKKGKLALGIASLVAGQQLPLNPRELVGLGARKLAKNPQVAPLVEQARSEVLDAGRTALSATANRRLESVADALQQRTNALLEPPAEEDEDADKAEDIDEAEDIEEEEKEEDEQEPQKADVEEEEEHDGAEEVEEEPPRRRPTKRPAGEAKKTREKKAPAKKTAAKKAQPKKSAAKNSSNRNSRRR